jgi:hypothetical protein
MMKSRTKTSSPKIQAEGDHKYPSISAAYWLPAPNSTPYLIPGMTDKCALSLLNIFYDFSIPIFFSSFDALQLECK